MWHAWIFLLLYVPRVPAVSDRFFVSELFFVFKVYFRFRKTFG